MLRGVCIVLALASAAIAAFPAVAGTQTLDQSSTTQDGFQNFSSSALSAQTFTAGASGKVYRVDLPLAEDLGAGATSVTVELQTLSGPDPSGTALASATLSTASLPTTAAPAPFKTVRFATPANVTAGTQYAIVLSATGGAASVASDSIGPYAGGVGLVFFGGIGWFGGIGDLAFKEYLGAFAAAAGEREADHVFLCYSKFEHDGGEVVAADQAAALIAAGRWLPSAIAGRVASGENHGDYHLDCNPPAALTQTGQWLGDGGDVVDGSRDAYYPIVG